MTASQVACQVASGYGALGGMKLHPVAITDISRLGRRKSRWRTSPDLPARASDGTVLIRMKTRAHIFNRPVKIRCVFPCFSMPERGEGLISLQCGFERGVLWNYLTLIHRLSLVCF